VVTTIRQLVDEVRSQMGIAAPQALPAEKAHAPEILRVEDQPARQENGKLILMKDVIFSDKDGDAIFDQPWLISADPPGNYSLLGGFIASASDEQKEGEARDPIFVTCSSQSTFVIDVRIIDQAFNQSEPVQLNFRCPSSKMYISPLLISELAAGLALVVALLWLLVRNVGLRRVMTKSLKQPIM